MQKGISEWNLNEVSCVNGDCRASGEEIKSISVSFRTIVGSNADGRLKGVVVTISGDSCRLDRIEIGDIEEGTGSTLNSVINMVRSRAAIGGIWKANPKETLGQIIA